jgi:hypothetical protein
MTHLGHENPSYACFLAAGPLEQPSMERAAPLEITEGLASVLDRYLQRLNNAPCVTVVDEMIRELGVFYDSAARSGSLDQFRDACQGHPLHKIALEAPFTERAFSKPRGYAGDAVMLDYIYRSRTMGSLHRGILRRGNNLNGKILCGDFTTTK